MKNSALYAGRVKKAILADAPPAARPEVPDAIRLMIQAILEENASVKQAEGAMKMVEAEFVDYNELRVAPVKDVVDGLGRSFPGAREKAIALTGSLHAVFEHCNALLMQYLSEKPKREVRKILREQLGLSRYAEAVLTLVAFDGHAIPVDQLLLEALKLDELIHSHSDLADLQGFLEGIVSAKDGYSAHVALRAYAARNAPKVEKELQRRRKIQADADAKARAKEEARLKAEAEAKAKADAEAKAKAEAEAAAKAEADAKVKAERKAAAKAKRKAQAAGKPKKAKPAKPAAESAPADQPTAKTPAKKAKKK